MSVITPELCQDLNLTVTSWTGPALILANGSPATPVGAVQITVANPRGRASGSAIVMTMDGMSLLLGNDFLKQFGKLEIDYRNLNPLITLGELPLSNVSVETPDSQSGMGGRQPIFSLKPRLIPARSVAPVQIAAIETTQEEPSSQLMKSKGLSAGRLMSGKNPSIFVTNFSAKDEWLSEGSPWASYKKLKGNPYQQKRSLKQQQTRCFGNNFCHQLVESWIEMNRKPCSIC